MERLTSALNQLNIGSFKQLQVQRHQQKLANMAQKPHHYYIYDGQSAGSFYALFSPMIAAVLEQNAYLMAAKTEHVVEVLSHYFDLNALQQHQQAVLAELGLAIELIEPSEVDFFTLALLKASLDPQCHQVILMSTQPVDTAIFTLAEQLQLQLEVIALQDLALDTKVIEFKKLFWKRKDDVLAEIAKQIVAVNAPIFHDYCQISMQQTAHLLDDLFYGEHLFEKVSVFGEFTETLYKHHLKMI